jgi:hypothetical protein
MPLEQDLRSPEELERQRMLSIVSFLRSVQSTGRDENRLTTVEQDQLEAIVSEAHDRPAVWAQNLLCYQYGRCRAWPSGSDGTDLRRFISVQPSTMVEAPAQLAILPNPADQWLSIAYTLPLAVMNGQLIVRDALGRVMQSEVLHLPRGQQALDTRSWGPGAYTVELTTGGLSVARETLLIKH